MPNWLKIILLAVVNVAWRILCLALFTPINKWVMEERIWQAYATGMAFALFYYIVQVALLTLLVVVSVKAYKEGRQKQSS